MCSDHVFTIIEWDSIKIDWQFQKQQVFSSVYPNEKSVKFQMLWLSQSWGSYTFPVDFDKVNSGNFPLNVCI